MTDPKLKLYVGCSLIQAPSGFPEQVAKLKDILRSAYEVFDFVGLTKGTVQEVYDWDINNCVSTCDLFLAICDYPSLGLGYEMAVAARELKKPVLAVAHADIAMSRLILGIPYANFSFVRYKDLIQDVPRLLQAKVDSLNLAAEQ